MAGTFLSARWENLIHLTYRVPLELLRPHLPPGLELEQEEGMGLASIVVFDVFDPKVFGMPWPGGRHFPQWTLRFYVRHGKHQGVVFLKEFAPKRLIAWLAGALGPEPCQVAPMRRVLEQDATTMAYTLCLDYGGRTHTLRCVATPPAWIPPVESRAHVFKEQAWRFGTSKKAARTLQCRVEHPVWATCQVQSWGLDADPALLYGPSWAWLAQAKPIEVLWAQGSSVRIRRAGDLSDLEQA